MGYSIAQEDLTDKWWLIGTFGLGYMATIPFKNIHPGLDDCTLIENTRTHFRIIRNTWENIFLLNYLHIICLFFLLSLSLMFLLFHIFQIYSPPACCYQSFYLSISLPETQPKKKPLAIQQTASHSKPLYPSIPTFKTAYAVKPVSRGVAPLSESQLQKRQEYDVRHSILVPGSDALRPKLATKAALKCLQRAEGGEEKGNVVGKYGGFFDDI